VVRGSIPNVEVKINYYGLGVPGVNRTRNFGSEDQSYIRLTTGTSCCIIQHMSTIEEQVAAVEKEIRETPYNKSTQRHHGILRAKLARLKDKQIEAQTRKPGGGGGYAVKKQGVATVVLVGPPSAGKSTLINKLTNAESKVAPYAFTTVTVIPGMLKYQGAYIQILDVPGLIEGAGAGKGRGREVLSVVRGSDLLIIMTDPARVKMLNIMTDELETAGIRINKIPPRVVIHKRGGGGIIIHSNIKQDIDADTIKDVAGEFGIKNAEITIKEKLTMDTLVDAFANNRVYVKAVYVVNKADIVRNFHHNAFLISAEKDKGISELKEAMWDELGLVRVYLVKPNQEPTFEEPIITKVGKTLYDVAVSIGTEFAQTKTGAKIWGNGAKFAGQEVSLSTKVQEGMQVRFIS
jgi:small GTP-binding protein